MTAEDSIWESERYKQDVKSAHIVLCTQSQQIADLQRLISVLQQQINNQGIENEQLKKRMEKMWDIIIQLSQREEGYKKISKS